MAILTPSTTKRPELSPEPARRSRMPWRLLSAGTGVLAGEGAMFYLHPALGEILSTADVAVPTAFGAILLAAILCGSDETCERVFRLLRWIANRPEPPSPDGLKTDRGHQVAVTSAAAASMASAMNSKSTARRTFRCLATASAENSRSRSACQPSTPVPTSSTS